MEKDSNALLVHILSKVDRIEDHVSAVRVDQAEIKSDLRYHIKRTDLLEAMVKELQKGVTVLLVPVNLVKGLLRYLRIIK